MRSTVFVLIALITFASSCRGQSLYPLGYSPQPWYKHRADGKAGREVQLLLPKGRTLTDATATVEWQGVKEQTQIKNAKDTFSILLPDGAGETATDASFKLVSRRDSVVMTLRIPAKRKWTVYMYPHSHVDIGYTNLQEEVRKLHIRNIDVGIDLARKTKDYPEGARFIWNPEATWVVAAYLKQAGAEQKQRFVDAVRKGWLRIDAGHSNINTSTCSDEEMIRIFSNAQEIQSLTGVPIQTMVQMDLPGAGWGLVPTAVRNGVTGFISFPNTYDLRKTLEHKPFYWLSQDGKSKLLFLQGSPYGYGYTAKGNKYGLALLQTYNEKIDRVSTSDPTKNFIDPFIFRETERLEREHSPYNIFAMTWSMADNSLIDADLPEAVRQWNNVYAYPKIIISGAKEILDAYALRYADMIPEYSGDFTEFWTDGLGSDARRVGMGRRAKEELVSAETLLAMRGLRRKGWVDSTWENLLLSAEHTWGFQNPKEPLAKVVEAQKAAYFEDAEKESGRLMTLAKGDAAGNGFAVVNTLSWSRSGIVTIPKDQSAAGDRVVDALGRAVPSQRLNTGELCFLSEHVPAFASKLYRVMKGNAAGFAPTDTVAIAFDQRSGDISSMTYQGKQYVQAGAGFGMNGFQYVPGVYNGVDAPGAAITASNAQIRIIEQGGLLTRYQITATAKGCHSFTREVTVYRHLPMVSFLNKINKISTREKEAIHFTFPFSIASPAIHMDIPWGIMQPEKDQVNGANRNWLAFQRWISISNKEQSITWTSIEAPVVELGELSGNILDGARQYNLWKRRLDSTSTLISWPLNNHWDTNFPLEQGGEMSFRYAISLNNDDYDVVQSNQFGMEQHRPLIIMQAARNPFTGSLFEISNPKVFASSVTGDADGWLRVRFRSVSRASESFSIRVAGEQPDIEECTEGQVMGRSVKKQADILPLGTVLLRVNAGSRKQTAVKSAEMKSFSRKGLVR